MCFNAPSYPISNTQVEKALMFGRHANPATSQDQAAIRTSLTKKKSTATLKWTCVVGIDCVWELKFPIRDIVFVYNPVRTTENKVWYPLLQRVYDRYPCNGRKIL